MCSSLSAQLAQESSLGSCLSPLLICRYTHKHWLLLSCCPSWVKKLSCRRKTWKLLVSILTDNMGTIAPGLLWCATAWSSILSRLSCSEIPNTQMLDKPSSSLLSLQRQHGIMIFIYISACVETYICQYVTVQLKNCYLHLDFRMPLFNYTRCWEWSRVWQARCFFSSQTLLPW